MWMFMFLSKLVSRSVTLGVISALIFFPLFCYASGLDFSFGSPSTAGPSISKTYDRNFRPNHGAVADMLSLSIHSLSLRGIDESGSKFTADLTLRTSWTDPRLTYVVNRSTTFIGNLPSIWFPPLFILDSEDETEGSSILIKPSGEIALIEKHTAHIHCQYFFAKLPFDIQECGIQFKSHALSTLHLDMVWNSRLDAATVKLFDSQFQLSDVTQSSDKERDFDGVEFRILTVNLKIRRNPLKYFKSVLLPGIIFTLLSYLTLFVTEDVSESGPNGVSVQFGFFRSITTLTICLLYQTITQIYYTGSAGDAVFTAADVWILLCSFIHFLLFFFNLSLLVHAKRHPNETSSEEKTKPRLRQLGKLLIAGIPIGTTIFLIIYFIIYLV